MYRLYRPENLLQMKLSTSRIFGTTITYSQVPTDYQLPTTDYRLPTTDYRLNYFPQYFLGAFSVFGLCDKGGLELSGLVGFGILLSPLPET